MEVWKELFENTYQLKGKMKEKVEANKELGLLSKKLVTIDINVPIVGFDVKDIETKPPNVHKLIELFDELEFRRQKDILIRDYGEKISEQQLNSSTESTQLDLFATSVEPQVDKVYQYIGTIDEFYQIVNANTAQDLLIDLLSKQKGFSFDLQVSSGHFMEAEILAIAFSYEKNTGYFLPLGKDADKVLQKFKPIFESESIQKIGYGLKRKIQTLQHYSIQLKGELFDVGIAHYLLNPEISQKIEVMSQTLLGREMITVENIVGKGKQLIPFDQVEINKQRDYFIQYADVSLQIKDILAEKLKQENLYKLYKEIEIPLIRVLADMEYQGINIDIQNLKDQSESITKEIEVLQKRIKHQAEAEFNLDSPKQLGEVLFDTLKLSDKPKKTKTGQYATSEEVLLSLNEYPIVRDILEYRTLQKLKSTYIDALPHEVNRKTKRIHTSFNQSITATGRLSSNNPNLQNIPIRTERGRKIREAFVPKNKDYMLVSADYSQIELRLVAEISKEENMINAFLQGQDIHLSTAAKVFKLKSNQVSKEQRNYAKAVNFGIIYGVSAFGLSRQTNLSKTEAKEMIDSYNASYPMLKKYMNDQITLAETKGYVETIKGRKRFLKNINSRNGMLKAAAERIAINTPIQGSAADIIKLAMIAIHREFNHKKLKSKILLQVHDELVFDIYKEELKLAKTIIKEQMENVYNISIPLTVDIGMGGSWLQAH